jgi:PHD/YefM family antitoxin component YafN of YafNO toxin-antitoxin module
MAKIVSFTEARANLTELLDDVENLQEHVCGRAFGRGVSSSLATADRHESLEETLDILDD